MIPLIAVCCVTSPAPTELYTLSLHDALPICAMRGRARDGEVGLRPRKRQLDRPAFALGVALPGRQRGGRLRLPAVCLGLRSEEHTSELQSHSDLVCRLLLEKKKINTRRDRTQ